MKRIVYIFIFPLLLMSLHSSAESLFNSLSNLQSIRINEDDSLVQAEDTLYYADYSDKFALFLYAKKKTTKFSLVHNRLKKKIVYSPNEQLNMGFGFNYKWLGIGLAFNFGFVNDDDDKYGSTSRLDWQTNIYTKKYVVDFYLQHYKGFYNENPRTIFPSWKDGDDLYIRPDITTTNIGIGGMYVFNHKKFSYKSAFTQTAIQKRSAGSFLLGFHMMVLGINADSSFMPSNTIFKNDTMVNEHLAYYVGAISAYAYNFVIMKHYFISMSLSANVQLGIISNKLNGELQSSGYIPVLHLQPRAAIGINKPKWYAGVSFVNDTFVELPTDRRDVWNYTFTSGNYRIFLGYRFDWFN